MQWRMRMASKSIMILNGSCKRQNNNKEEKMATARRELDAKEKVMLETTIKVKRTTVRRHNNGDE